LDLVIPTMRKKLLLGLVCVTAAPAFAAGLGLKAGLWEVKLVKQTVDGHDVSASIQRMEQAMATMPPEQRARVQAMLKQSGVSQDSNGGFRICVTPEMAKRDTAVLDKDGRCRPTNVTHSGNQSKFQFSCTTNGVAMNGQGQATSLGNIVKTHTEVTMRTAKGITHQTQSDSQMTYLGSDCGTLKPSAPPSRP
jgi:hypothetical protein